MRKRLCVLAAAALCGAARAEDLAAGKLLIASRDLLDPNFAQTVVLLVRYEEDSVAGIILNRRTQIPIARVFSDLKEARSQADPIYRGGPVERTAAIALLRSPDKPDGAEHIFANVSMIADRAVLDTTIALSMHASMFHVYLGYAGWTAEQLRGEVDLGAWFVFPATGATVFDPEPETLWSRMIRKTEQRIALTGAVEEGVVYTNANDLSFGTRHFSIRARAEEEGPPTRAEESQAAAGRGIDGHDALVSCRHRNAVR